jgi:hypothetical protein
MYPRDGVYYTVEADGLMAGGHTRAGIAVLILAALFGAAKAQNADTGRRDALPWEKTSAAAVAAPQVKPAALPKAAAVRDTAPRTNVLVQKRIHVSDLDRFLDMWR